MRLMIKQRVFAWTDTYDIYDEYGNEKYFVKTEMFNIGHHMHIYDGYDREVGVIHQKLFRLLPAFEVEIGGRIIGQIHILFPNVDFCLQQEHTHRLLAIPVESQRL